MKTKLIGTAVIAVFVAVGCGKNEGKKREAAMSIVGDMVAIPDKDFKMGKHEVTQAQWEAVMGNNPSAFKGADLPVRLSCGFEGRLLQACGWNRDHEKHVGRGGVV